MGITEVDLYAGIDSQVRVLRHLCSLVPGQRSSQLLGQGHDCPGDSITSRFGPVTGECRAILDAQATTVACHARQMEQKREACRAFNESTDCRTSQSQDEISLAVTGHSSVGSLCRPLTDHDLRADKSLPPPPRACARHP
jgi:hypothetical protein